MRFKVFLVVLFCSASLHGFCNGQSTCANDTGIVVSVSAGNRIGNGVVVSAEKGRFEVWTCSHVAGRVGRKCIIGYKAGCIDHIHVGTVVASVKRNGFDGSRIVADGKFYGVSIRQVRIPNGGDVRGYWFRPLNGVQSFVPIRTVPSKDFDGFRAFSPSPIHGHSGSPVVDNEGRLVGIVVGIRDPATNPLGYYIESSELLSMPTGREKRRPFPELLNRSKTVK